MLGGNFGLRNRTLCERCTRGDITQCINRCLCGLLLRIDDNKASIIDRYAGLSTL